jgi:hypothetical protein
MLASKPSQQVESDSRPFGNPSDSVKADRALIRDPHQTIEVIGAREHRSERSIRMTLSLAFVAPPIVAAAIEGRLPHGFGSKRMMDLPMVWSHQWTALGLKIPTSI